MMDPTTTRSGPYDAELAFTPPCDVSPDPARPGLQRARTLAPHELKLGRSVERHRCPIGDLASPGALAPDLVRHGFDVIDLACAADAQQTLESVRVAGHVTREDARAIRRGLTGTSYRLSDGSTLRILFVAPEGFIMRKAGPNGLSVTRDAMSGMNDHDAAATVHADQDVKGTPLRRMMRGAAPWLFRHDTPDARNRWSPLMLLNLWIPLQQITRPLALMDKRTLDRRKHQLRYGLPTDAFLDRSKDQSVNDIWKFLYDEQQRWYFTSEMDARSAYVFETLGTPHGSFIVPGEDAAARGYLALEAAAQALQQGDESALRRAAEGVAKAPSPPVTTPALGRAIENMDRVLEEVRRDASSICSEQIGGDWPTRAKSAMDRVVRKSVELRVVALRIPRAWPRRFSARARPRPTGA